MRNTSARQTQIDTDLLLASKELLDSNARLEVIIHDLELKMQKNFKSISNTQSQPNKILSTGPITIRDKTILEKTEEIDLAGLSLEDQEIFELRVFWNIKSLLIGDNKLGNEAVKMIVKNLTKIEKLQMNSNCFTGESLSGIRDLSQLRILDVRNNNLGQQWLVHLQKMDSIQQLSISKNKVGLQGTRSIATLQNLRYLDITNNEVDDQGVTYLLNLKKLTYLYLMSNRVTLSGLKCLFVDMPKLEVIDVRFNAISQTDRDEAKALKPLSVSQLLC